GSVFSFRFAAPPVHSVRDLVAEDPALPQALFLNLLAHGVLGHARHSFLCAAHTDEDTKRIVDGYDRALEAMLAAGRRGGATPGRRDRSRRPGSIETGGLAGRRPLGVDVHRVQGLTGGHEQAVPLGPAEADVAADLREPDAPDQLAPRGPDGDAAVADGAPGVARAPHVALDVTAGAVRAALHPVDHEVGELLVARQLVVGAHVEDEHLALAARPRVSGPLAGGDDVELLVVGREDEAVRVGGLALVRDHVHP